MKTSFSLLAILLFCSAWCSMANAVDESPIDIEVVEAFPNLEIPRPEDRPYFRPVVITHAADGSNRLFFASQQGAVYAIPDASDDGVKAATTFLDIEDKVVYQDNKNEEGFLGLSFHPKFQDNGQFFVYYTTKDAPLTSVVSRFTVSANDPNKADPDSEVELMRFKQPFWNHNGGSIEFGPDGYLYIGLGDGGAANDTKMNGQNVQTYLGSILRIDVDAKWGDKNYGIPASNRFADQAKRRRPIARPEIYAYGFRNPWRLSFDPKTGAFWVADVGQDLWEEINIVENGGNYGWNLREGWHKFGVAGSDPRSDLKEPVWEYDHEVGKSITGGAVYRGKKVPSLDGYYLYADYVTSKFWALKYNHDAKKVEENRRIPTDPDRHYPIMTFGHDQSGEVYCSDAFGKIYRFQQKN